MTLDYTTKGKIDQVVTIDNAPGKGGGLYYRTDEAAPTEPPPTTPSDPWDPFSLGNPLTRKSPVERLGELNDALNAMPDRIDDAFERSRDRINERSTRSSILSTGRTMQESARHLTNRPTTSRTRFAIPCWG